MRRYLAKLCLIGIICAANIAAAGNEGSGLENVWLVGKANGTYSEFTQKPLRQWLDGYDKEFPDGFDIKAGEKLGKDAFPGIQAGPADSWGAHKTYPLRIHFELSRIAPGGYALTVGLFAVTTAGDVTLSADINGMGQTQAVTHGTNKEILAAPLSGEKRVITDYFPSSEKDRRTISYFLPPEKMRVGANVLTLTVTDGSWAIYDYVRLEGIPDASMLVVKDFAVSVPPYLARHGKEPGHLVRINFFAMGMPVKASSVVRVNGKEFRHDISIRSGQNRIDVTIPEQTTESTATVWMESGAKKIGEATAAVKPVRHLTIMLMPHSHLDIGYPDLQPSIMLAQKQYLEHALDIIGTPHEEQMTWVAEASWPMWLMLRGIGAYDEYGGWMGAVPLLKSVPDAFWKETERMLNVAPTAAVRSSAQPVDTVNDRRAVDGSPIGWNTLAPASGAWLELSFKQARRPVYIALRNGREEEGNTIQQVRLTMTDNKGKSESRTVGPLGADRERLLVSIKGLEIKKLLVEIIGARYNERPAALMEVEVWEKAPPERIQQELLSAIRKGDAEVTGFYMNFLTQLIPTEWLIRSMLRSNEVARRGGVKLKTALLTDVPGFSFALPDVLAGSGIRYFYPALNSDHAYTCLEGMPRAFIWEGPGGGRVLVFHSVNSYIEGWDIGFTRSTDLVEENLPRYLAMLDAEKYPYDRLPLRTLGDVTDDGPVAENLPLVVAEWNRRWSYPRMVIGTPAKFFPGFEAKYGKTLPVLRGDWTSYWEDGEGSTAKETTLIRTVHHDLLFAGAFGAMQRNIIGKTAALDSALSTAEEYLYLYDEHTWGADMSVGNPNSPQTTGQWELKKMPSWAAHDLTAKMPAMLEPLVTQFAPRPKHGGDIIGVINSSGQPRSGYAFLPDKGSTGQYKVFDAETEKEIQAQHISDNTPVGRVEFRAENIPAMGIKYFEIVIGVDKGSRETQTLQTNLLENSFYKIIVDEKTGRVTSIFDKSLGKELVDGSAGYAMNEFIYVPSKDNTKQERITNVSIEPCGSNTFYSDICITGTAPHIPKIMQAVRLYHQIKKIEFINFIHKEETLDKEGGYFAFPIRVPGGEMRLEVTGGVMAVEKDQLPGASRDWISIQDGAGVVGSDYSVLLATPDAPLIVPVAIRVLSFQKKLDLTNTTMFSYAFNNYWHTNYKASQGGGFLFRYALTSKAGRSADSEIIRFGNDAAEPFKAIWGVSGKGQGGAGSVSFLSVEPANVRLLGIKSAEDGKGFVVRLQEMDGKKTRVRIKISTNLRVSSAARTNLLEEDAQKLTVLQAKKGRIVEDQITAHGLLTVRVW